MDFIYAYLPFIFTVVSWYPFTVLGIICHEAGHYTVYRLLKKTPMWVEIGSGPLWFKFMHRGTWIQFHKKLYTSGMIYIAPGHFKSLGLYGAIVMIFAGPMAHLFFGILLFILGVYFVGDLFSLAFKCWGIAQIVLAVMQLIPKRSKTKVDGKETVFENDGYLILSTWRRRAQFKIINENW